MLHIISTKQNMIIKDKIFNEKIDFNILNINDKLRKENNIANSADDIELVTEKTNDDLVEDANRIVFTKLSESNNGQEAPIHG